MKIRDRRQYRYNIHGIISLESDIWLPELSFFRIRNLPKEQSVRIVSGTSNRDLNITAADQSLTYHDGVGKFGFWIHLEVNETTVIQVSPLLQRSPHVLYTNLVEPVLRWMFVERGYIFVHGACFGLKRDQNEAFLVTAKTDTGKTTTILKLLDRDHRLQFLSDDLTLLARDRTVLSYPKPLTISQHTVSSVRHSRLTDREKFFLPIQSRLHSRGGRQIAHLLSQTPLPMATINALMQLIVPPPKYPVHRLVPGAQIPERGKLAGLYVIERGTAERQSLVAGGEAAEILSANTADAFGFPPYDDLEPFLAESSGIDLRSIERQILVEALEGVPGRRIESGKMNWADHIASHIDSLPGGS